MNNFLNIQIKKPSEPKLSDSMLFEKTMNAY